tara:strand:- start:348 stop:884 length:537 start_codon:yes stop_codon:yes gene_type:complete
MAASYNMATSYDFRSKSDTESDTESVSDLDTKSNTEYDIKNNVYYRQKIQEQIRIKLDWQSKNPNKIMKKGGGVSKIHDIEIDLLEFIKEKLLLKMNTTSCSSLIETLINIDKYITILDKNNNENENENSEKISKEVKDYIKSISSGHWWNENSPLLYKDCICDNCINKNKCAGGFGK